MADDKMIQVISDDELSQVSGGVIFDASNIDGADPAHPYEVLNNANGTVLARFADKASAFSYASQWGNNPLDEMEIEWPQVCFLRGQPVH